MEDYKTYDKGGLLRNRYLKVSDISEGSYGLVSVAKDTTKNNKLVAVKFIYPVDYKKDQEQKSKKSSGSGNSTSVTKTKRSNTSILRSLYEEADKEIRIQKILGLHPNIASLYDNFDSCLVLEYCSRGDLYEAIHSGHGPSTSQDIKDVFHQILNALEFCHSQGVYHRDLKPENILIAEDWSIKFCDWGLATTTKVITNRDEFDIGSERYMAPELFDASIESYDASKIDIWSVGIILLTLVFHKNPFQVANYSDKRFLQFVNNREALFDVFSTMSGEMFSVLRFSLNIDPTNRDLASLRKELNLLKYFTIDEEYWGSDYEYEEEEGEVEREVDVDDFEFEHDDFFFKKEEQDDIALPQNNGASAEKSIPNELPLAPSVEVIKEPQIEIEDEDVKQSASSSSSTTESSSFNSKSQFSKVSTYSDDTAAIPHNHRADALLSSNTDLKPIPISNSSLKFIRNTRKPFNVPSLNQTANNGKQGYSSSNQFGSYNGYNGYQNGNGNGNSTNKFIREDFFTPKSVSNHYLDKYGEQRYGENAHIGGSRQNHTNGNYSQAQQKNSTWSRHHGRKPRTWKKNTNYNNSNKNDQRGRKNGLNYSTANTAHSNANNRHSQTFEHSISYTETHLGSFNANRRKSRSFSLSKPRKNPIAVSGNTALAHPAGNGTSAAVLNNVSSSLQSSHSSSVNGSKYIPPYMRSPTYAKSPLQIPLSEDFDNLTLSNDYDEVFQLEDDFDLDAKSELNVAPGDIVFKKPNFRAMNNPSPEHLEPHGQNLYPPNYKAALGGYRQFLNKKPPSAGVVSLSSFGNENSHPQGHSTLAIDVLSSSASGKYVPPFRRSSHVPPGTHDGTSADTKSRDRDRRHGSHDIGRSIDGVSVGTGTTVCYPLSELNKFAANSVPVNSGSGWTYKKDCIDYD